MSYTDKEPALNGSAEHPRQRPAEGLSQGERPIGIGERPIGIGEGPIGIVGALPQELADLRRRLQVKHRLRFGAQQAWEGICRGRRVILMQSGMGRARAEEATELLLDRYPLSALLCIGFGGGVSRELRAGDIVVCPSVYEGPPSGEWALGPGVRSDKELIAKAEKSLVEGGLRFHLGDGLTVDRIVSDPDLKEQIGKTLPVKAVDMESFWIARQAFSRRVPLLVAWAITDPVDQSLPDMMGILDAGGKARIREVFPHLLRHPSQVPPLFKLAGNARRAAASLGTFTAALIGLMASSEGKHLSKNNIGLWMNS